MKKIIIVFCLSIFFLQIFSISFGQTITTQTADQTVLAGTSVTFSIIASGATSYQWQYNGVAISGATQSSYTISQVTTNQAGLYSVIIFSTTSSIQSKSANLNVIPTPTQQSYTFYTGLPNVIYVGINNTQLQYSITSLPSGLTYNPLTGFITGTLNSIAQYNFNIVTQSIIPTTNNVPSTVTVQTINVLSPPIISQSIPYNGTSQPYNGTSQPFGLAINNKDEIFSTYGNQIVKIAADNTSTIIAGTTSTGAIDSSLLTSSFNSPEGLAIDSNGNIFVADTGNSTIRKISTAGTVSTIAGVAGLNGNRDGIGALARFNSPQSLCLDSYGNIYVADTGNNLIRKITPSGSVTTLIYSNYSISSPVSIISDSNNLIYFIESTTGKLYRINSDNTLSLITQISSSYTSRGFTNYSYFSGGITADKQGNIYAVFSFSLGLQIYETDFIKVTPTGVITNTKIGSWNPSSYSTLVIDSLGFFHFSNGNGFYLVGYPTSPYIITQPQLTLYTPTNQSYNTSFTFNVKLGSSFTINWYINYIPSNFSTIFNINTDSSAFDAYNIFNVPGTYIAVLSTPYSSILTDPITVASISPPVITTQPISLTSTSGSSLTLSSNSTGSNNTYQWNFNGVAIAGATSQNYTISNLNTNQVGNYTVSISNSAGTVTSKPATVGLSGTRLVNLSLLGIINSVSTSYTTGFIINGIQPETVLVRAIGPGLTPYVLKGTNLLLQPQLTLYDSSGTILQRNNSWGNSSALINAFNSTGAFSLSANSNDAAILIQLQPGAYTAQVTGLNGSTGQVLIEVYEVSSP